ncbi:LysE family translocator [Pseudoalteromonas fenneropenaei]|uniref:LysE family translocator n=1 Tax=Pseudoalteromonas fenneropenaei TaxID=1737459 RepID=A0ABV7CN91_9GAMM
MDYVIAVLLFALVSSITPGPNNILVMTSGVNFGIKRSLPLLAGICSGFTLMLLVVSLGFASLFQTYPQLHLVIKWLGVIYLIYLAWLVARSGQVEANTVKQQPLNFLNGALFQWINGKAWVVATGAIAAYTPVGQGFGDAHLMIVTVFLFVSFPCVGLWLVAGAGLQRWLSSGKARNIFNYTMSILLILSVLPVLHELLS